MPRADRIAIVLPGFEIGGAERQALLLAEDLVRRHDRKVIVAAWDGGTAVVEACRRFDVATLRLPAVGGRWRWLARLRAARALRGLRPFHPDVIVPFTLWPNVVCGIAYRHAGARAVLWNQRDEGRFSAFPHQGLVREAVSGAHALVANSAEGAGWIGSHGGRADAVRVIANGCTVTMLGSALGREAARHRLGLHGSEAVVSMIANQGARKDHATLVAAWIRLHRDAGFRGRLLLAGRGSFEPLLAEAAAAGIAESISCLGFREDVATVISASDLVVHATHGEGLPNAVIEAMVLGCPVVGSDVPGVREVLGPFADGRLVPPGHAVSMAEAIARVLSAPSRSDPELPRIAAWAAGIYGRAAMADAFLDVIDGSMKPT